MKPYSSIYTDSLDCGVFSILASALSYATGRAISNNLSDCELFNYGAFLNKHENPDIIYNTENALIRKNNNWNAYVQSAKVIFCYDKSMPGEYWPLQYFPFKVRKRKRKDIDVLFCGFITPRRAKILYSIRGFKIFIVDKQLNTGYYKELISRSKVVLSIKAYPGDFHNDSLRVIPLLCAGANVIAEDIGDNDYLNMIFSEAVIVSYDSIPQAVDNFLDREYNNTNFRKNYDLRIWTHRTFGEICV